MALWAIFGRPCAANCTLIERSRTFFREADPEEEGGDRDVAVNDELRADATGGWVTDGLPTGLWFATLLSVLSPIGIGSVGLSGSGVLLHLLPCL